MNGVPSPVRLVLLEFITGTEVRDHQTVLYPFLKGFVTGLGQEAAWLCIRASSRLVRDEETFLAKTLGFEDDDLAMLLSRIEQLDPTHVIYSHVLEDGVLSALRGAAPNASWIVAGIDPDAALQASGKHESASDRGKFIEKLFSDYYRTGWFTRWLNLPDDGDRFLVDAAVPDYQAEALNDGVGSARPFMTIIGGVTCDYRKDAADNPIFASVDLSACGSARFGCSFCSMMLPPMSDMKEKPALVARRQLEALAPTAGINPRYQGRIEISDIRLFNTVDVLAEIIASLDMPPTSFHFAPGADCILRALPRLEKALELLKPGGHSIVLFRSCGVNFVPGENRILNSGIDAATIDAAFDGIVRLQVKWREGFSYAGGLNYIQFTPWTTLEALTESWSECMKRNFEPAGSWTFATLELEERTPACRLALSQGDVIVEDYEDRGILYFPISDLRVKPAMIPWRFRDPRTALAFRCIVRGVAATRSDDAASALFFDDDLYLWMVEQFRTADFHTVGMDRFGEAVIEVIGGAEELPQPEAVVRCAMNLATGGAGPALQPGDPGYLESASRLELNEGLIVRVMESLETHPKSPMPGWKLTSASGGSSRGNYCLKAVIERDERRLELLLYPGDAEVTGLLKMPFVIVSHDPGTPPANEAEIRKLRDLAEMINLYLDRD